MVIIKDYKERVNQDGELFYSLILEGDLETVRSQEGNTYFTARTASVPCTFDEARCQSLIGNKLPGKIRKVKSAPYEYEIPESGEVVVLDFMYVYESEPASQEEEIFSSDEQIA